MSSITLLAETTGDVADAGKAIALALGIGLGSLGAGIGIGNIFGSMIQAVARQPELRGELTGIQWLGFAHRGGRLLRPDRRPAGLRPGLDGFPVRCWRRPPPRRSSGGLIDVVPGLMIWTLIAFGITFFVLKRFAFGAGQDHRRPARADPDGARGGRPGARGGRQLLEQRSPDRPGEASRPRSWPRREGLRRAAAAREGGGRGGASAPPRGDAPPDRGRDGARSTRSGPRSQT